MRRREKSRPMAEINVVPYIDVMLVLLIIFMVTAPLLTQGVQVDLPQASAAPLSEQDSQPLIVSVDVEGRLYLNVSERPKVSMAADEIALRVAAELKRDAKRSVLVRGDMHVDYGKVMAAMVLLQQAGAKQVGLVTDNPPESQDKS